MRYVTPLLDRAQQGDPRAAEELLPLVYDELRKLAAAKMASGISLRLPPKPCAEVNAIYPAELKKGG